MILLDTSVLSRAFRRSRPGPLEEAVRQALTRLGEGKVPLGVPAVVVLETLSGIRSEQKFAELEQQLLAAFPVVHPQTGHYVEAARLRNSCEAAGLNVSGVDCLIATMAISGGHRLFAIDEDFESIAKHAPLKLHRIRLSA